VGVSYSSTGDEWSRITASAADIGVREYLAARKPLEEKLQRALDQDDGTPPDVVAPLIGVPDVDAAWDRLDLDRQRAVLAAVASEVRIEPAKYGARFDPERVQVVWKV
jgi:hypothetical protein